MLGRAHRWFIGAALILFVGAWRRYLKEAARCRAASSAMARGKTTRTVLLLASVVVAVFVGLNLYTYASQQVDLLDCDFPYNVNYLGGDQPNPYARPKQSRKWSRIYSDDMPQADYEAWMRTVLTNVKQVLKPGAAIYIWQGHRQFPPMYQILLELGFHVSSVLCWMKECAALSYADYSFQTEQCLYGWLKGAAHYWAGPPGESNLWQIKRDPTKTYCHPTQKPVALGVRALKNSSRRGDLVLDTFLGSGSLLLACESLGRRCYGIELDPKYCDVIVRRYLAFVGKDRLSVELQARYCQEASHESV